MSKNLRNLHLKKKFWVLVFLVLVSQNCARQRDSLDDFEQARPILIQNLIRIATTPPNRVLSRAVNSDGSSTVVVNASDFESWSYLLFSSGTDGNSTNFDLAIQRFKLATNSGVTRSAGKGGGCKTNRTDWDTIVSQNLSATNLGCADSKFLADANLTESGVGGVPTNFPGNPALNDWYNYSIGNLAPNLNVYLVKTGDGSSIYLLQILKYYSSVGSSGYPTLKFKKITP